MNLTAVVLNWRRPGDTIACVASLLACDPLPRVVVVDNGSGDGSLEAIAAAHPDVPLIANPSNDGYAGGNNIGIARALEGDPDAVFVVNNDVVIPPEVPGVLARHLGNGTGITSPLSLLPGSANVIDFYTARVDMRNMALIAPGRDEPEPDPPLMDPVQTDYSTGSAMMIDARILRRLTGFDPRYFLVWEDVDLCLRARKIGARCLAVPSARVRHERSVSFGGGASPLYQYFFVRNSFLFLSEHGRWPWRDRTRAMIERRYEGQAADRRVPAAARAIALGLEHGRAGRFGPPDPDVFRALTDAPSA